MSRGYFEILYDPSEGCILFIHVVVTKPRKNSSFDYLNANPGRKSTEKGIINHCGILGVFRVSFHFSSMNMNATSNY